MSRTRHLRFGLTLPGAFIPHAHGRNRLRGEWQRGVRVTPAMLDRLSRELVRASESMLELGETVERATRSGKLRVP